MFERKAVRALIAKEFSSAAVDRVLREAHDVTLVARDSGYVVEVSHPALASVNRRFDLPLVRGRYEDLTVRFTGIVQNQKLQLKCSVECPSGSSLRADFRDLAIEIFVSRLDAAGQGR